MAYVDPQTIHNPSSGAAPPATWGDQVRDDIVFLYARGPLVCTSGTRPGAPAAGDHIFETDTKRALVYDGSGWWTTAIAGNAVTTYSSTLQQVVPASKTDTVSEYRIVSGICEWWFVLAVTSGGSAGTAVSLTVPVTAAASGRPVGEGNIADASGSTEDTGLWYLATTTTIQFIGDASANNFWGISPSIGIASGDTLYGHIRYAVASAA